MQGAVTPRPKDLCNGLAELAKEQHAKLLRICRHPMCSDSHQGALWRSKWSKDDPGDTVAEGAKAERVMSREM